VSGSYAVGANYLSFSVGTAGAAGTGAYTIVVLAQPAVGNNGAGMCGLYTSGSANRDLFEDANALYGANDFSSGFGALTQGNWYLCAQTKAAGSNTYRHHLWAYASDGSGTMSHGVSAGSSAQGDGSAITEIRLGATEVQANGLIAVAAVWTSVLSDADLDGFKSANLSTWTTSSGGQPKELISLENWNGASGASVLVGTSSYSSTTGTVSSGSNPPGFSFALTAAADTTTGPILIAPGRSGPGGRWQLPPADFSTASTASPAAETTSATGAAFDATVSVGASAETTTGTGAANDASAAVAAAAESAAGTGAANTPTIDLQANAGNTTATGAANDISATATVNAENATATGAANDATVSTAANTSANAENAAGTGTANDTTVSLAATAEPATAAGTAFDASISITINVEATEGTGTAEAALGGVGGQADVADATSEAFIAALAIQASAEAAAALGAALDPTTGGTTIKATSTATVTARRTSTDAVTARRTSSGGVS
jgi:hypothetical protein